MSEERTISTSIIRISAGTDIKPQNGVCVSQSPTILVDAHEARVRISMNDDINAGSEYGYTEYRTGKRVAQARLPFDLLEELFLSSLEAGATMSKPSTKRGLVAILQSSKLFDDDNDK